MIQLDLAIQAGFSVRPCELHRNRVKSAGPAGLPVLAETLRVPLRERNRLLEAGGFAHVYPAGPARRGRNGSPTGSGPTAERRWFP